MANPTPPPAPMPSAQDLLRALSGEVERAPTPRPTPTIQMPRPRLATRLLMALAVGLLAGMALMTAIAAWALEGLAQTVVTTDAERSAPAPALPAVEVLRDPQAFAVALARRPEQAVRLYGERALVLQGDGHHEQAVASFAAAAARGPLPPVLRLQYAELLLEMDDHAGASRQLDGLDCGALPDEMRPRALAAIGRCHLALPRPPVAPRWHAPAEAVPER